jgi:hypothetical protein
MRPKAKHWACLYILLLGLARCAISSKEPDWTWVQVGQTDTATVVRWFGEPKEKYIDPVSFGGRSPWETWFYEEAELGFRGSSVVERLFLARSVDPILRDGYTVREMLTDYGLPEVVYEDYEETMEGIGIYGWEFVYPTRGDEFIILSMFVVVPERNQPPPPTLELMLRGQWVPGSVEQWLEANGELASIGVVRVEDIEGYFMKMDTNTSYREPVAPSWSKLLQ